MTSLQNIGGRGVAGGGGGGGAPPGLSIVGAPD